MQNFIHNYYTLIDIMVAFSHAAIILFVVIGLALLLLNSHVFLKNRSLRIAHIIASAYVTVTSLIGIVLPVHELEDYFSREAGGAPYPNLIPAQWLQGFLGTPTSDVIFLVIFLFLTSLSWILFKLRPPPTR